jgi:putative sterol carrier protein
VSYQFLSDEWVAAARKIREEADGAAPAGAPVKMNLVITDVPFGESPVDAHMDTTSGGLELDFGHIEAPDVTVTLDYVTARSVMVDGDPNAAMQAFMAGKIKLQGDMTKALALQQGPADPELAGRIREITTA